MANLNEKVIAHQELIQCHCHRNEKLPLLEYHSNLPCQELVTQASPSANLASQPIVQYNLTNLILSFVLLPSIGYGYKHSQ